MLLAPFSDAIQQVKAD